MADKDFYAYYFLAMKAMADILGTILIPGLLVVVVRVVYDHLLYEELVFFISLLVVFLLSMMSVIKKVHRYGTEYQKLTDEEGSPRPGSGSGS